MFVGAKRIITSSLRRNIRFQRCFNVSATYRDTFRIQDQDDFNAKVLNNPDPVVVDFSATWCGPCKLLTPRLDAAIATTEGKVHLAIVDIDELADIAMEHDVSAVPTVLGMKDGAVVDKFVGLIDEDKLGAFIDKLQ